MINLTSLTNAFNQEILAQFPLIIFKSAEPKQIAYSEDSATTKIHPLGNELFHIHPQKSDNTLKQAQTYPHLVPPSVLAYMTNQLLETSTHEHRSSRDKIGTP